MKTPVWLLMLLLVGLIFFSFLPESRIGFCIYTVSCCMGYLPVGKS